MALSYKGDYAPDLFNEEKRYFLLQAQQLSNLTDAELREAGLISNTLLRRFIHNSLGNGTFNDGFKILQASSPSNDLIISGGNGSADNPGAFWLNGYYLFLKGDINYSDQTNTGVITDDGYTESTIPALTTPTGTTQDLNSIDTDGTRFFSCGASGSIIKTSDAGRNWIPQTGGSGTLNSLFMVDASYGYVAGSSGKVFKTTDGGSTAWGDVSPGDTSNHNGIYFVNSSKGWVVGSSGFVTATTNGGTSWINNDADTTNDLNGVWFHTDESTGWSVGQNGFIAYTNDAGYTTWQHQNSGVTTDLNYVEARNASVAYAVGNSGVIRKTINAGTTWSALTSSTTETLYSSSFVNDNTGYISGSNGLILKTFNAGANWTSQRITPDGTHFKSIAFKDATGFVVGNDSGSIYRSTDAGTTWEKYRTDYVYIDMYLAEVSGDSTLGSEYYDSTLVDATVGLPSQNRLRIVSDVRVSEGWSTPSDYFDTDATLQHYTAPLAQIQRVVGQANILQSSITDLRSEVMTFSELTNILTQGGIDGSGILAGSIDASKLDSSGNYTFGTVMVTGDTTIGGNLEVLGTLTVTDTTTSLIMDNLTVLGSATLGDPTVPYDDTVSIHGRIIQKHDTSAIAYSLTSASTTLDAPIFNIDSAGTGTVFNVFKTSNSPNPVLYIDSTGKGYDITIIHRSLEGGLFNLTDDASGNSISLSKANTRGSIFDLTTISTGNTISILNRAASDSTSVYVDQTSGLLLGLKSRGNASAILMDSAGSGTDLSIKHAGLGGIPVDITSSALNGTLRILNNQGPVANIIQKANVTALSVDKDGTGDGLVLELNNYGSDTAFQINTDGPGISQHISHVGDSTNPALHIFIGGSETGDGVYVNKSNDATGTLMHLWNQGFSSTLQIVQDKTDSSASVITIVNDGSGNDISSSGWRITGSSLYITDVSSTSWYIDSTGNLKINTITVDYSSVDASDPAIAGRIYRDSSNFLKISAG